jgi:inner membrane protein
MCLGVAAANAPDVDLLYTSITEEPIGYLLHHRGHSHTLPGLAALGLLIWSSCRLLPLARAAVRGSERPALILIAAALFSHLLMDAANSYGTHLFYPLSSRWVYGDAVFVLEPWLWASLGATLALNAVRQLWRWVVVLLTLFLIGALAFVGLLQVTMLATVLAVIVSAAFAVRAWAPKRRATAVLIAASAMFLVMPGVSALAKREARRAVAASAGGELVDIVADANPAVPWCWAVMTLHRATDRPGEILVGRRATLSLLPSVWPASACASARLSTRWSTESEGSDAIVWHRRWDIDVEELRALSISNCRVQAWLQFGRVPYVAKGSIADIRFEHPIGQNFTPTVLSGSCPAYLTNWDWPRRDVLAPLSDRP